MRVAPLLLVTAGAAALLGACQKKSDTAAASGVAPSGTAASPLTPASMPHRKPGLWKLALSSDNITRTFETCVDEASEAKMSIWGAQMSKDLCQSQVSPQAGGGFTFTSSCKMGAAGTTVTSGSASGDFSSHYTVKADSTTSGAAVSQMDGAHSTTIDATWTGPCAPGQKGGDMILPNGMKVNALEMGAAGRPGG